MDSKLPFPNIQKEGWLQKVEEDLKGKKSPEDFIRNIEDLKLDPFILPEETQVSQLPLDRLFDQMERGVYLTISNAHKNNSIIKTYLKQGASSLYLHVSGEIVPEELLEGIHLEYIFVLLKIENKNVASEFVKYLDKNFMDKSIQTFILCGSETIYPGLTYMLEGNLSTEFVLPLTHILSDFEKRIQTTKPYRCVMNISIGKDFLMTISALRAFRILWENMVSHLGYEGDIALILCATPDPDVMSEEKNQALIEMSYITLSAILGNVDIFFGRQPEKNQSLQEGLKILHLQHIFLEEGRLDAVKDPVSGSLYIEQTTKKLAEKVWENFLRR